jgi:hypothetical protein
MFIICFASSSDFYLCYIKQMKIQPFNIPFYTRHCSIATAPKRPILAVIGRETPMLILILTLKNENSDNNRNSKIFGQSHRSSYADLRDLQK